MKITISQKATSFLKAAFSFAAGSLSMVGGASMVDAQNGITAAAYIFDRTAPALLRVK